MTSLLILTRSLFRSINRHRRTYFYTMIALFALMALTLAGGKTYQHLDNDKNRGAIPLEEAHWGEAYQTPMYLDQGWGEADSLWFYTTTQGSNLLPYDFFLSLEQADNQALIRDDALIDRYRYLPQKATFFNPDALPVGFAKDTYQGRDYLGFTCAACHTGQINYQGMAIRIDGGPSMANMPGFLNALEDSLRTTLKTPEKFARFAKRVIALDNDYRSEAEIKKDLDYWLKIRRNYNLINRTDVEYGYARLDAFGRIYNRILQHVISPEQLQRKLLFARDDQGQRLFSLAEIEKVLDGIDGTLITRNDFLEIIERLMSHESGYPALTEQQLMQLQGSFFNEPNAPVSYPFLWDTTHSDYVQWNGIASNAAAGPLGRNVGEVLGVFATIDWRAHRPWYAKLDIAARVSGQQNKRNIIQFKTSADLTNLQRLENHLNSLKSPKWPEAILGAIDAPLADEGERIYAEYCQSCHELVDRDNWDRIIIAKMSSVRTIGTDPAMAENGVSFRGSSGNFRFTYQGRDVGKIVVEDQAPAAVLLTAATSGVVTTPDADKTWVRRWLDWLYLMAASFFDNDIEDSVRSGNYDPDTMARPFDSLMSYKARPLNGIWATAPYLHNGSVPTLYDVLLPARRDGDDPDGEYRPDEFRVGSREFDPVKIGFKSEGYEGFLFATGPKAIRGNSNQGHEYAAGRTAQPNGEVLPALNKDQRLALLEYLKTL